MREARACPRCCIASRHTLGLRGRGLHGDVRESEPVKRQKTAKCHTSKWEVNSFLWWQRHSLTEASRQLLSVDRRSGHTCRFSSGAPACLPRLLALVLVLVLVLCVTRRGSTVGHSVTHRRLGVVDTAAKQMLTVSMALARTVNPSSPRPL